MANEQNLKPARTKSEARERGRKGGIASGESRREKATLRECLELLLAQEMGDRKCSGAEILAAALFKMAAKGSERAFELIRDTVGEKPSDRIDHTSSDGSMSPYRLTPAEVAQELIRQSEELEGEE